MSYLYLGVCFIIYINIYMCKKIEYRIFIVVFEVGVNFFIGGGNLFYYLMNKYVY